ncbi:amidase [Breoghania sp. L-A4]|uniref:amidase n=1 Tax=Breoghania sp. L-A4 TaxID=2304600 RepID=UPI000E35F4DE|nr:amidase [Breoghania sp. L-A4]AXS42434.1 amidase [Breoghania sp. L-A4]
MTPDTQTPNALSATEAARKIRDGLLTSESLVQACLARIKETDGQIKAWAQLDPERALAQAREMDEIRRAGRPMGALHGVPVGLKDIIDTADFPTERGTPIFAGRESGADATIVERLRDAGAVVLGKTVTTELAFLHPAQTRNPHNTEHTPGGSSSGSAAAVAAFHVPLAVGTQTNGSVIRPASFCGVHGFKPTRGVIARTGLLQTSQSLDQVGVFGRTLEDVALLTDAISGYDQRDALSYPRPRPHMLEGCRAEVPVEPSLAWFDLPFADRLTADGAAALNEVVEALGARVERLPSPPAFAGLVEVQRVIHEYEICRHLREVFEAHWDRISPSLQPVIERARGIPDAQYEDALGTMQAARDFFSVFFHDYDAVIAPSATGEAPPVSAGGTGDPVFCTIWTLAGLPCVSLPLLVGSRGLPIGVQLIGTYEADDRLLRTARWVVDALQQAEG